MAIVADNLNNRPYQLAAIVLLVQIYLHIMIMPLLDCPLFVVCNYIFLFAYKLYV